VVYGKLRTRIGRVLRSLCEQKDVEVIEGSAVIDHVHMVLSIPPKYSIAMTMGYLKGKSAIRIHRELLRTRGTLFGREFWARGYCVSTVGLDEATVREYVRKQEDFEKDQGELEFD
jgi:putative transposase